MSLLARLFRPRPDDRAAVRPLWHALVARSRDPRWYAELGVADTVAGRFDAITLMLAMVLLRMEGDDALRGQTGRLTELFVEDMDGQLRESGVGDLVVGKRMGKLMSVLGGRLDAIRTGLAEADNGALIEMVKRNVTLIEGAAPDPVAAELRTLSARLAALPGEKLLAGELQP